jgi:glyoxylase-like metal-dependent hydrolase (beta-lactamase superfamily II)
MLQLKKFVFNAFQVNTYLVFDETGECVIIDAACENEYEEDELASFIESAGLKPVMLLSTHAHIDHILGNAFVAEKYKLELAAHADSNQYLHNAVEHAASFGMQLKKVIKPGIFLTDGQELHFGNSSLLVLETPGHANGSICFYNQANGFIIAGDVLFYQSIGRTDLPGGDYDVIKNSIWVKLFVLPDDTVVYPGHGPETSIGSEKVSNPFVAIG